MTPRMSKGWEEGGEVASCALASESHTLSCSSQFPHFPHTRPFSCKGPVKTEEILQSSDSAPSFGEAFLLPSAGGG